MGQGCRRSLVNERYTSEKTINRAGHHRQLLPDPTTGFDVVILSDLLHFNNSHELLVESVHALLSGDPSARVYISVSCMISLPLYGCIWECCRLASTRRKPCARTSWRWHVGRES